MVRAAVTPLAELPNCAEPPLVLDCVRGDRSAWRRLHQRYHPVSVAFLRRLGVSEADLEDATQEVFLEMFRYLPRFRGSAELTTWLYRLCITQARRSRRRRRVAQAIQQLLLMTPVESWISSPAFSENLARKRIEDALKQLSEAERSVFVLYEMEGLPGKQIAEILGCKEATLWRRLHYARKRFLEAFEPGQAEANHEP
jgi:RNA polymerase sigma-70 factor, ECF subfamily